MIAASRTLRASQLIKVVNEFGACRLRGFGVANNSAINHDGLRGPDCAVAIVGRAGSSRGCWSAGWCRFAAAAIATAAGLFILLSRIGQVQRVRIASADPRCNKQLHQQHHGEHEGLHLVKIRRPGTGVQGRIES